MDVCEEVEEALKQNKEGRRVNTLPSSVVNGGGLYEIYHLSLPSGNAKTKKKKEKKCAF